MDESVGVVADSARENTARMAVGRVRKRVALTVPFEPGRLDFAPRDGGLDAVQFFCDIPGGALGGHMVDDDQPSAGLDRREHGRVEGADIDRPHERIMQVM